MHAQTNQSNLSLEEQLINYTWQKRVLLIVSPSANEENYIQQREIVEAKQTDMQERDLEMITLMADKISQEDKNYLNKKFTIDYTRFNAVLIGKDGGSKLTSSEPFTTQELFETIDAMPMRKQEMKKNKK